jgi:hypothetical protein
MGPANVSRDLVFPSLPMRTSIGWTHESGPSVLRCVMSRYVRGRLNCYMSARLLVAFVTGFLGLFVVLHFTNIYPALVPRILLVWTSGDLVIIRSTECSRTIIRVRKTASRPVLIVPLVSCAVASCRIAKISGYCEVLSRALIVHGTGIRGICEPSIGICRVPVSRPNVCRIPVRCIASSSLRSVSRATKHRKLPRTRTGCGPLALAPLGVDALPV